MTRTIDSDDYQSTLLKHTFIVKLEELLKHRNFRVNRTFFIGTINIVCGRNDLRTMKNDCAMSLSHRAFFALFRTSPHCFVHDSGYIITYLSSGSPSFYEGSSFYKSADPSLFSGHSTY